MVQPVDNETGSLDGKELHQVPRVRPGLFPAPPNWDQVFAHEQPLELEIGFGRPHFFLERAAAKPTHNIVGIEWKRRHVAMAQKNIKKNAIPNACALHGNAWWLTGGLFPEASLHNIFINFPDPWWKKKHAKRRIVNDVFADLFVSRLVPGGHLLIQTDVASLLEGYMEAFEPIPQLRNKMGPFRLFPYNPSGARSHREKKCVTQEIPIFRVLYEKTHN
tara:strand:- start:2385 stop:3041 length:657 start_codon:yes stop_codon:yes gene_type:complete